MLIHTWRWWRAKKTRAAQSRQVVHTFQHAPQQMVLYIVVVRAYNVNRAIFIMRHTPQADGSESSSGSTLFDLGPATNPAPMPKLSSRKSAARVNVSQIKKASDAAERDAKPEVPWCFNCTAVLEVGVDSWRCARCKRHGVWCVVGARRVRVCVRALED